jgi:hypothetical protein
MATTGEFRAKVQAYARELLAEQGLPAKQSGEPLFTTLEDAAMAIGDAVTQEILAAELTACGEGRHDCPRCRAPGLRKKERRRTIQSRRGDVELVEPEYYCKRCRRSFFPSLGGVGFGAGTSVESEHVGESGVRGSACGKLPASIAEPVQVG